MHQPSQLPKRLPYTGWQILLLIGSALTLLATITYTLIIYPTLPTQIATHYGITGVADGWGDKSGVLMLLAVDILLWVFMVGLSRYPRAWSIPYVINEANAEAIGQTTRDLLLVMAYLVVVLFAFIQLGAGQEQLPLGTSFVPLTLLGTFLPILWYIIRLKRLRE